MLRCAGGPHAAPTAFGARHPVVYNDDMAASGSPTIPVAPFDREIGLVFTDIGPDGARATLELQPKLSQPAGLVHGGVYCSVVECGKRVRSRLAERGRRRDRRHRGGVNNNTDFLRGCRRERCSPRPPRSIAAAANSCGW